MWYCTESDSAQYHTARSRTLRSITLRRVGKLKCLKIQNSLTLRRVRLRAVWYCAESDSSQCDTAPSPTPCSVSLCQVKQFVWFSKTYIYMTFRIYCMWWYFEKIRKHFENPKMANTAPSRTPRSVILPESDSVQCDTASSWTLHSITLCGVNS